MMINNLPFLHLLEITIPNYNTLDKQSIIIIHYGK